MAKILEYCETTKIYQKFKFSLNEKLIDRIYDSCLSDVSDSKVLEAACGSGYGASVFKKYDNVAYSLGLDIDKSMYQHSNQVKNNTDFVLGDLFKAPLEKESFDLVWSSSSVEHFASPSSAINAMIELTKPGGYVFVGVPFLYGPLFSYYLTPSSKWREWIGRPFSKGELVKAMENSGKIKVIENFVYFYSLFIGMVGVKL